MKTLLTISALLIVLGCTKKAIDKTPTTYSSYTISYDTVFYGSGLDTGSNMQPITGNTALPVWIYSNNWDFIVPTFDSASGSILDSLKIVMYTNLKITNFIGPAGITRTDSLSSGSLVLLDDHYSFQVTSLEKTDTLQLMDSVLASYTVSTNLSAFLGKGNVGFIYSPVTAFFNAPDQASNVSGIVPADSTAISITYFYRKPS